MFIISCLLHLLKYLPYKRNIKLTHKLKRWIVDSVFSTFKNIKESYDINHVYICNKYKFIWIISTNFIAKQYFSKNEKNDFMAAATRVDVTQFGLHFQCWCIISSVIFQNSYKKEHPLILHIHKKCSFAMSFSN